MAGRRRERVFFFWSRGSSARAAACRQRLGGTVAGAGHELGVGGADPRARAAAGRGRRRAPAPTRSPTISSRPTRSRSRRPTGTRWSATSTAWRRTTRSDLDIHPYHPLAEFKYGNEVVTDAMIRLKGQSSWREAVEAGDNPPKLQFVISFNEVDPTARFHGLRKVELDMPRIDPSYLRQRLALSYLRALGLPAQCANSGRLIVNGTFYGLYTNLERPEQEFLQRVFPGAGRRATCGTAAGAWRRTRRPRRSPTRGSTRGGRSTTSASLAADRGRGRGARRMGGRGDDRRLGRLLDRPPQLLPLRSSDARLAVDPARPRRDHRLGRANSSIRSIYWGRYTRVGRTVAALRRGRSATPIRGERYVAALRHAYDVFAAAKLPEQLDRYAAPDGRRGGGGSDPAVHRRRPRRAVDVAARGAASRAPTWSSTGSTAARPAPGRDADGDGHAVLPRLQRRRPGRVSGRARDLRRRPRSELRRQRHRRLLTRALLVSPDVLAVTRSYRSVTPTRHRVQARAERRTRPRWYALLQRSRGTDGAGECSSEIGAGPRGCFGPDPDVAAACRIDDPRPIGRQRGQPRAVSGAGGLGGSAISGAGDRGGGAVGGAGAAAAIGRRPRWRRRAVHARAVRGHVRRRSRSRPTSCRSRPPSGTRC